jgi:hypothetical protein
MLLCIDLENRQLVMSLLFSYIDKEDFVTDDVIDIGYDTQIINIIENILKQNKFTKEEKTKN